jgi:hypothetical protein
MNTPVIDPSTLSEEQRERILEWWSAIVNAYCRKCPPTYGGLNEMFTEFFGKDFYKKLTKGE